jgi:hypothetical protein
MQVGRSDESGTALSEELLQKLRDGYAGFLAKVGDVQTDDKGALPRDALLSSEALQRLGLTEREFDRLISRLPSLRPYADGVQARDLFQLLGSLISSQAKPPTSSGVLVTDTSIEGRSEARVSWTAFDASDSTAIVGNSVGCISVVRLEDGQTTCVFHETLQPLNGLDMPIARMSPVTVCKLWVRCRV